VAVRAETQLECELCEIGRWIREPFERVANPKLCSVTMMVVP
jgi:hypothetical protein